MAHSLVPPPITSSPIPAAATRTKNRLSILGFEVKTVKDSNQIHHRREFIYGLIGVGIASSLTVESASAAKKRTPPPPQEEEKKDPNVTGVRAKILASIKRKEAMKEEMAKLRERGKPVN